MYKYTKRGIEKIGESRELLQEDLEFIEHMFDEFSNYEKSSEDLRNHTEDEMYGEV